MMLSFSQVNSVKHAHYYRCQGGDLYYLDNNRRARLDMERESIKSLSYLANEGVKKCYEY